ncbi:MAG: DUF6290 family protein [Defluviitaleaceae bacterium]|nr:DUF6290 family protein [Defluviitaleaceae bacterium]
MTEMTLVLDEGETRFLEKFCKENEMNKEAAIKEAILRMAEEEMEDYLYQKYLQWKKEDCGTRYTQEEIEREFGLID